MLKRYDDKVLYEILNLYENFVAKLSYKFERCLPTPQELYKDLKNLEKIVDYIKDGGSRYD